MSLSCWLQPCTSRRGVAPWELDRPGQHGASLGTAVPTGPRGMHHSPRACKTPKDPASPLGVPHCELIFEGVSQKWSGSLVFCYSFIRPGLRPPAGQTLFTLRASCSGGPPFATKMKGSWGRRLVPVSPPTPLRVWMPAPHPPTHPISLPSPAEALWQGWARNATLGPKEAFPGWGLEERGPGQVARADGSLPTPKGETRLLPASHAHPS